MICTVWLIVYFKSRVTVHNNYALEFIGSLRSMPIGVDLSLLLYSYLLCCLLSRSLSFSISSLLGNTFSLSHSMYSFLSVSLTHSLSLSLSLSDAEMQKWNIKNSFEEALFRRSCFFVFAPKVVNGNWKKTFRTLSWVDQPKWSKAVVRLKIA